MRKLTELIVGHPIITLVIIGLITGFFLFQMRNLKIDNDLTSFLPWDDPTR